MKPISTFWLVYGSLNSYRGIPTPKKVEKDAPNVRALNFSLLKMTGKKPCLLVSGVWFTSIFSRLYLGYFLLNWKLRIWCPRRSKFRGLWICQRAHVTNHQTGTPMQHRNGRCRYSQPHPSSGGAVAGVLGMRLEWHTFQGGSFQQWSLGLHPCLQLDRAVG